VRSTGLAVGEVLSAGEMAATLAVIAGGAMLNVGTAGVTT
jgi:hypothetical protein